MSNCTSITTNRPLLISNFNNIKSNSKQVENLSQAKTNHRKIHRSLWYEISFPKLKSLHLYDTTHTLCTHNIKNWKNNLIYL